MVNREGRRFARDDQGYLEFARVVLAQPGGVALEIFDRRVVEAAWQSAAFRAAHAAGAIRCEDSVSALAQQFSVPGQIATLEVDDYNIGVRWWPLRAGDPRGHGARRGSVERAFSGGW